ncbi:MAG TPA: hypothetical protein DCG37_01490 [Lachnospiraceae bacterium]|nr:hypothetical protein [Lachnospiraceae bacterium]
MKKIIPLLLASLALIFATVGIGYSYISNKAAAALEEDHSEKKVYTRGDGTSAELKEDNQKLFRQYILTIPTPEIVAVPAQEVERQDFSPNADTVVDKNGYQTIPDNSTVTDVRVRKLRTKYFSIWIPGCWVGNVVAECRYIDQKSDESTYDADAVKDTISLRFYEKQNYEAYVAGENEDYPYATGLLTEFRYTSTENDNSWLKTSNYETYIGDGILGELSYNMFLYEIHNSNDLTSPEYEKVYSYLTKVNYPGCMVTSLKVTGGGKINFEDNIKSAYVDTWDDQAEGISLKSTVPEDGLLQSERELLKDDESATDIIPEST